ncbi:MAG: DUF72 domain-containing protein [Myxococcota bacterium]|nr:DUF72 domain-containing protein [Myxococcota bacterium]
MDFDFDAATRLPKTIRFGTSSWKYPGWKGTVYRADYRSKADFEARSLKEYGDFPWFRAVGLDASFYRPPSLKQLQGYARQLPDGMCWLAKVWDRITVPHYGRSRRYGDRAGKENPDFLDPVLFREGFLENFREKSVWKHTGPFILQFQTLGTGAASSSGPFLDRLDSFLAALPDDVRCAVELRSPELLTPRYFGILNERGATHCFSHWDRMPPLIDQMRASAAAGGLKSGWYLARLLTPRGVGYQAAVERFQPYDRLQAPQAGMRRDVQRFLRRALEQDGDAWVLVNNRVEGNAPQTIDALGRSIVAFMDAG